MFLMIQQQSKLCLGAIKLVQWPSLARSVTRTLWPSRVKSHISSQPYCISSIQNGKPSEIKTTANDKGNKMPKSGNTITAGPAQNQTKPSTSVIQLPPSKEIEAVLKVKALSSALDICSTFNPQQRIRALKNLVSCQSRPLPLIQKLTDGIGEATPTLNIKELSDLLFVLAKLRFHPHDVLSRACEALKNQLKGTTNAAVVGSSISSLRKLQWKDSDLLDEYSKWIEKNFAKFQNPSVFINTLALQNHSPPNLDGLLKLIWKRKTHYSPEELINLVWSINVLNTPCSEEETRKALNGFFNRQFLKKLRSGPESVPVWIQLWNLQAVAKSLWGNLASDLEIPDEVKSHVMVPRHEKAALISEVTQLLFKDLDSNLYSANAPSNMGFPIDFTFCVNKDMTAVPQHLATSDSIRLAAMIHSFRECCQPTKEPNGYRAFEMRLLKEEYKVISIPYHILGDGYAQVHDFFESSLGRIVQGNKSL